MVTDPISDLLVRLQNGFRRRHDVVSVPASRLKREVLRILPERRIYSGRPGGRRGWTCCAESPVTVCGRRATHGYWYAAGEQARPPRICRDQGHPASQKRHWRGDLVHLEGVDDGSGFSPRWIGRRSSVLGLVMGRENQIVIAGAC